MRRSLSTAIPVSYTHLKLISDKENVDFAFRGVACYKQGTENPIVKIVLKLLQEETKELNRNMKREH